MKKIVIGCIFILNILIAEDVSVESFVPKNYTVIKSQGDLNNNYKKEVLLDLENFKENKRKLILLEEKGDKQYQILFESNTALNYPKNNGQGYMVQNISASIKENNLVISTHTYAGKLIIRDYYFKLNGEKLILDKFVEQSNSKCDNETVVAKYTASNIEPILYLKDFSLDSFFKKYYSSKEFQRQLIKVVNPKFNEDYFRLLKLYKNNFKLFKEKVRELLVYDNNTNKICSPRYYLDKYIYLDKELVKSNDMAYFFEQAKYYKEAIYMLEKILEKYPNRTVAYYNLGDAYWELEEKEKAIEAYQTYINQMNEQGKSKRIPQAVKDRVKGKK